MPPKDQLFSTLDSVIVELQGQALPAESGPDFQSNEYFRVAKRFSLTTPTRGIAEEIKEEFNNEIVGLTTDDGAEWYGLAQDLPSLTASPISRSRNGTDTFKMPRRVKSQIVSRGGGGGLFTSLVKMVKNQVDSWLDPEKALDNFTQGKFESAIEAAGEGIALPIGRKIDKLLCPAPGLYRVGKDGARNELATEVRTDRPILLFIHGTFSSFEGGFSGMPIETWSQIHAAYEGEVYALDHRSITESPVRNVLDLLGKLPEKVEIDLVTHSRGGLVGDVLARLDARLQNDAGYSSEEVDMVRREAGEVDKAWTDLAEELGGKLVNNPDLVRGFTQEARKAIALRAAHTDLAKEMEELTVRAKERAIKVGRFVRVACPAAGTTLLTERMDHFLNAALHVLKLVAGPAAPLVALLRQLVTAVLDERRDPAIFPGIYAMVPDQAFSRLNNSASIKLPCELINIAGNTETGEGLGKSILTILSNLYYWQGNDYVVDTASMSRGVFLRKRNVTLTIRNSEIWHSAYFSSSLHRKYFLNLLLKGTIGDLAQTAEISYGETYFDRSDNGRLVDKAFDPGTLAPRLITGNKPIIVLLPGIMGSNLSVDGVEQWFQLTELGKGGLRNSLHAGANVQAESVMKDYYEQLQNHLLVQGYEVRVCPYDWRLSLKKSAQQLAIDIKEKVLLEGAHEQSVTVLAHSMGGLVFRQLMFDHPKLWVSLRDTHQAKLILLGTPWRGSHLITEVLAGYSNRVKQLATIDLKHTRKELLESLYGHSGIFELLPLDDSNVRNANWWAEQRPLAIGRHMPPMAEAQLMAFSNFRDEVDQKLQNITAADWERIYYVAGQAKTTVDGYEHSFRLFSLRRVLKFTETPLGDGSVTWEKGIPQGLDPSRVYYTKTAHGELANDPQLFGGLMDLIRKGRTKSAAFSHTPPVRRNRGAGVRVPSTLVRDVISPLSPLDIVMGAHPRAVYSEHVTQLNVEVFNGDLKWAKYPVLVGHFEADGIVSAERAIDIYLGNILSERHQLGFYPGQIGEQEVIYNAETRPLGTVVVGLGSKDDLTSFSLSRTVAKGMLKYAIFLRDNKMVQAPESGKGHGISVLFIGSNYGQMPLRESIRSILVGIRDANEVIADFNKTRHAKQLKAITTVEFVDYYEDRAYEAFKSLAEINDRGTIHNLQIKPTIISGFGRKKRFIRDGSRSWWQTLSSTIEPNKLTGKSSLEFRTSNRGAAYSEDHVFGDLKLARMMAEELSTKSTWAPDYAKALFELLLPNRYKDFIRNHNNMIWRMDPETAAFPWEMFHDSLTGDEPTFVRAGMVRQLLDGNAIVRPTLVQEKSCLVVANPPLGPGKSGKAALPDLPAAKEEGIQVRDLLQSNGYTVEDCIEQPAMDIALKLYSKSYKIIHFASHGIFEEGSEENGIVIGPDVSISAGNLRQLSYVPELVFVNCCYLGEIDPALEAFRQGRHKLAANIGTQLIRNGVKAVIVAGWAVDDAAAATFSKTFYQELLAGEYFGEAVRKSREVCYQQHSYTNTWGAYQCYGDPFYRADLSAVGKDVEESITLQQEVVLALDNLINKAQSLSGNVGKAKGKLLLEMNRLMGSVEEMEISSSSIKEREAEFYVYLGEDQTAVDRYQALFSLDNGMYKTISYLNSLMLRARVVFDASAAIDKEGYDKIMVVSKQLDTLGLPESRSLLEMYRGGVFQMAAATRPLSSAAVKARSALLAYQAAAEADGWENEFAINAVTKYMMLATFLNAAGKHKTIDPSADMGVEPRTYIEERRERFATERKHRNSLHSARHGYNLALAELVYEGHRKELSTQEFKQLVGAVREQLGDLVRHCLNLRDLKSQARQIKVMSNLFALVGPAFEPLVEALNELETETIALIK